MISALSWIPKGSANLATPEQAEPLDASASDDEDLGEQSEIEQAQRFAAALKATAAGSADREPGNPWKPVHPALFVRVDVYLNFALHVVVH